MNSESLSTEKLHGILFAILQGEPGHRAEMTREEWTLGVACLADLNPDVARKIIRSSTPEDIVWFPCVEKIDIPIARELAKARAAVSLSGLTELDAGVAKALVRDDGVAQWLGLDALAQLDEPAAAALAKGRGVLTLNGLPELDASVARLLGASQRDLHFRGLKQPGVETLAALAEGSRNVSYGHLHLDGIATKDLDQATAEALAQINRTLHLGRVTHVDEKVAKVLARCQGGLSLPGVYRLTDRSLTYLAEVPSQLDLSGLREMPSEERRSGVHALMARKRSFVLSRYCRMGRTAKMLLRCAGERLCFSNAEPAGPDLPRCKQLIIEDDDKKLSWERRVQMAKEICRDVFRALAGDETNAHTAPWSRWMTEEVGLSVRQRALGIRSEGDRCSHVYYFLAMKVAKGEANQDQIAEDLCLTKSLGKLEKLICRNTPLRIRERGGDGLFSYLYEVVKRDVRRVLKQYHGIRMLSADVELANFLSDALSSPQDRAAAIAKLEGFIAQAEHDYQAAKAALEKANAEKGNRRGAQADYDEALIWREWLGAILQRLEEEEGVENSKPLTQEEFVEMLNASYPEMKISQSKVSRTISARRRAGLRRNEE
jgi:hypothetical protein